MITDRWLEHASECILSQWSAGEPTPDGGYRTMYAGQWYQNRPVDETPKCNCGLDEAIRTRNYLLGRASVAVLRFRDDPANEKRLTTLDNIIEELRELSNES